MSLLSPERLHLFIAPGSVQAIHFAGLRSSIVGLYDVALRDSHLDNWPERLQACATLLAETGVREVQVVVSDRLVRYLPLPWNPDLRGEQEERAFAVLAFEGVYGEGSGSNWTVSISHERPGQTRLGCAISTVFMDGLRGLAMERHLQLRSVKSHLCSVIAVHRQALPRYGWLATSEAGWLTLLQWDEKGCRWVGGSRAEDATAESVMSVVAQRAFLEGEMLSHDGQHVPVFLSDPRRRLGTVLEVSGRPVHVLGLPSSVLRRLRRSRLESVVAAASLPLYGTILQGAAA